MFTLLESGGYQVLVLDLNHTTGTGPWCWRAEKVDGGVKYSVVGRGTYRNSSEAVEAAREELRKMARAN